MEEPRPDQTAAGKGVWPRSGWLAAVRPRAKIVLELGFVIWCALWTLLSASSFYRSLVEQTGGEWSAPLDDVFIHFDYARATALDFYRRLGYAVSGEEFIEVTIPHRLVTKAL